MKFVLTEKLFSNNSNIAGKYMAVIKKEKLSNKVYTIIKEMIANHRFEPGARMNVEKLSKEFGISRTPVWEAVRRLEQEGLLENIPNRGVFMAVITPQMALALYEVREVLEGMAARLAATRISEENLAKMESLLVNQGPIVKAGDLIAYSRSDFEFHAIIYEASGNPVLEESLQTIKNKMRPFGVRVKPALSLLYKDHEQILQSLKNRNPEESEKAIRIHNQRVMSLIREKMDSGFWPLDDQQENAITKSGN
jgi:DNA-binding GntR family transcriptional regulator